MESGSTKETLANLISTSGNNTMKTKKEKFKISGKIYDEVYNFIGSHRAERGMMIGRDKDGVITHCEFDHNARCNAAAYDPDIAHMNKIIKEWETKGIQFCGFIHSHPKAFCQPSSHDKWYAGEILSCFKKLDKMWVPIVQTVPDTGKFELLPFAAIPEKEDRKKCTIVKCKLDVIGCSAAKTCNHKTQSPNKTTSLRNRQTFAPVNYAKTYQKQACFSPQGTAGFRKSTCAKGQTKEMQYFGVQKLVWNIQKQSSPPNISISENFFGRLKKQWDQAVKDHATYFKRLNDHYDLDQLDKTRLVIVGTGGAAALIRNCARMGFGEYILIDPDVISESNVGTQDVLPSTVGKTKVEVLARDIVEINPKAAVIACPVKIEQFDDNAFASLLKNPLRWDPEKRTSGGKHYGAISVEGIAPEKTILMVLTDNFYAQARGHRLGLHFGIPTICAMEYVEGIGAEVTYTVPGVTPACHRCITAGRYKSYLEDKFENDVTSAGAPVFAAEFLNAVLGHMLLSIIHHGTKHPRWGNVITELGNRNLLKIRMDNSYDTRFGNKSFSGKFEGVKDPGAFHMLDTLFLPQTPDCGQSKSRPVCPDCGGKGDLESSKGKFTDTLKTNTCWLPLQQLQSKAA
jgi:ThiF family